MGLIIEAGLLKGRFATNTKIKPTPPEASMEEGAWVRE
jgi:hypothetical protein